MKEYIVQGKCPEVVRMWRLPLSGAPAKVERNQPIMPGGRAASLTRGWAWCPSSGERHPPLKPQCTGKELRLLPLPPGKAQAACCRLCVAPRTLSFKSSSGMHGLVSSILPQSHVALRKNSETTEIADPALAASRWGRLARQLGCLSPPTS